MNIEKFDKTHPQPLSSPQERGGKELWIKFYVKLFPSLFKEGLGELG